MEEYVHRKRMPTLPSKINRGLNSRNEKVLKSNLGFFLWFLILCINSKLFV